jgi:glucokinase
MIILAGDIGGTHSRIAYFAVEHHKINCIAEESYRSADYESLDAIVTKFVKTHPEEPVHACFGVAGPVHDGRVKVTNLPWTVEASLLARELGLRVTLINDLEAIAYSVPLLTPQDLAVLNEGDPSATGNAAVIAAGTGLGEAGLYWHAMDLIPFACEGGHTDFAPTNDLEDELLRYLRAQFGHVSWERVVSGMGLLSLYAFLRDTGRGARADWIDFGATEEDPATQITRHGLDGTNSLCVQVLEMFVSLYGNEAGNLALKMMATGGIFIGGGIAPRILEKLRGPGFVTAFAAKGRLSTLLNAIPVRVILKDKTGLLGAARCAALQASHSPPAH